MTDKEALKRIAEKLRRAGANLPAPEVTGTIEGSMVTGLCIALVLVEIEIEALAQSEQEPVVWADYESKGIHHKPVAWMDADGNVSDNNDHKCFPIPLYTHLPQRKPLTDEEIFACENSIPDEIVSDRDWCIHFARAIEAAHDIKETT
jgi:hypothetical protein